jgi:hypothetical protein
MICFLPILDPESRFWLPAVLLLLPLAVEGLANIQLWPPAVAIPDAEIIGGKEPATETLTAAGPGEPGT